MKKTPVIFTCILAASIFAACGGGKTEETTPAKADTVATAPAEAKPAAPAQKDFFHYDNLAKTATFDSISLSAPNAYSDSATKSFSYSYTIANAAEAGADKITFMAGSVQRLGNKEDILNQSLDEFKAFQTKMAPKGVKAMDFKEYQTNGVPIYYCTFKGVSDAMGGKKNYNRIFAHYVHNDVYLDMAVDVWDNQAPMHKAEKLMMQMADYMTK